MNKLVTLLAMLVLSAAVAFAQSSAGGAVIGSGPTASAAQQGSGSSAAGQTSSSGTQTGGKPASGTSTTGKTGKKHHHKKAITNGNPSQTQTGTTTGSGESAAGTGTSGDTSKNTGTSSGKRKKKGASGTRFHESAEYASRALVVEPFANAAVRLRAVTRLCGPRGAGASRESPGQTSMLALASE